MTIFWFRRDLRLEDNCGFFEALDKNKEVLPIFIFDKNILKNLPKNDARVTFIHQLLTDINSGLGKYNKKLAVFFDTPQNVFQKLIAENIIESVYTNHDYEPYAVERENTVYQLFKDNKIDFYTSKDQVVFEKSEVTKDDGLAYLVYTPYSKKWKEKLTQNYLFHYPSETLLHKITNHNYPFLSLEDIGFEKSNIEVPTYQISAELIRDYEQNRNFPALNKTSFLGAYLRFGAVSVRKIVTLALADKNQTFLNELIWREFFMQILWHFPYTKNSCFKPKYDEIVWKNNEDDFKKWCEGKTGYPFVDAGMRELNATGFMHNRVRMIVASFLCKHLLIDWRCGEAYFAQKLFDYDMSSNVGNWQWAAGCGVDAAPYFRIFNPTEQIKKFDNKLQYIKKWVPEFDSIAYPKPIIDHKFARERCLETYKNALI